MLDGSVLVFWLVVCLVAMSRYYCCSSGPFVPGDCEYCTTDNNTITVTFAGIADGASCNQCDETFNGVALILTRYGFGPPYNCYWQTTLEEELDGCYCPSGDAVYYVLAKADVLSPGTRVGWYVYLRTVCGTHMDYAEYKWDSGGTADFDCTATRSLTRTTSVPDATETICALGGSSCQVN